MAHDLLGNIGEGLSDAGGAFSSGAKSAGSALGALNPLHASQSNFTATPTSVDYKPLLEKDFNTTNLDQGRQQAFANALASRGQMAGGQQQQLIGQLQNAGAGNDFSANADPTAQLGYHLAQQQLQQSTNMQNQQMAGAIASARGMNPALAAQLAGQQAGVNNQAASAQAAQLTNQFGMQQVQNQMQQKALEAQYRTAARGQLGSILGNEQGLTTGAQAGMEQQLGSQNLAKTEMDVGRQARNMNAYNHQQDIMAGIAGQNAQLGMQAQQINAGVESQNAASRNAMTTGIFGGLANAAGAVGAGYAKSSGGGGEGGGGGEAHGGRIEGRAPYSGDNPRNDIVSAKLSPGEIVIPRSAAGSKETAHKFIDALMGGSKPKGYGAVLQAKRELAELHGKAKAIEHKLKLYKGGEVEFDDDTPPEKSAPIAGGYDEGGNVEPYDPMKGMGEKPFSAVPEQPQESASDFFARMRQDHPDSESFSPVSDESPEVAGGKAARGALGNMFQAATGQKDIFPSKSEPQEGASNDKAPNPNLVPTADTGGMKLASMGQSQDGQQSMPGLPDSDKTYNEMQGILRRQGNAAAQRGDDIQDAFDEYNVDKAAAGAKFDAQERANLVNRKQLTDAIANGKIDPQRLWHSADTGSKVMAAIGIILSGIGSGLTGQKNLALEVINNSIDKDVKAQEAELGKKQSLLSENLREYGNIAQARAATMADMHASVMAQVQGYAAKAQGAQAQGQLQLAGKELQMRQEQLDYQRKLMGAFYNSPTPPSGIDMNKARAGLMSGIIPKEQAVAVQKEMEGYEQMTNKLKTLDAAMNDVASLQSAANRLGNPKQSWRQIEQKVQSYSTELAKDIDGRATPQDIEANATNFAQFLDNKQTINEGKANIESLIRGKHGNFSTLKTYNLISPNDPMLKLPAVERGRRRSSDIQLISGEK